MAAVHHAVDVQVDHFSPVLDWHLEEGGRHAALVAPGNRHAGVIHKDVHVAKALPRNRKHAIHLRSVADIGLYGDCQSSSRFDLLLHHLGALEEEVVNDDAYTLASQFQANAASDALTATSYQADFALQVQLHFNLLF
ncbi:hypothetical protein D9M68_520960 [compost metagenome]